MKRTFTGLWTLYSLGAVLFSTVACVAQNQREDWVSKSSVIFKGEVILLHTSTIDWKDPASLGVVRLQEIFEGERQLTDFLKEPITVQFTDIGQVKKGQQIIVYGNIWIAGESIAVAEVGHEVIGEKDLTSVNYAGQVKDAQQRVDGQRIKVKASKSEIVIAGTVTSVRKAPVERKTDSEHDPEWMLAEIKVDESLKGSNTGATITFAFPGSDDVMWYLSPRFKEGIKGIWFLSKENFGYQDVKQFTITTQDQVRDIRDLDKVKQALR